MILFLFDGLGERRLDMPHDRVYSAWLRRTIVGIALYASRPAFRSSMVCDEY